MRRPAQSHGSGLVERSALRRCPDSVVLEPGALVFHPENISLGDGVYVGHHAILKGYHQNELVIGDRSWIGQAAFLHAAGGITIGADVGIGPHVCLLTSTHSDAGRGAIMDGELSFSPIVIEDGADLGVGSIVLPGVTIGRGAQIGAGAVVTTSIPAFAVAAGNPARVLRSR
jgi:acetyltransferase-like isoleucine patch superfamily enzyme